MVRPLLPKLALLIAALMLAGCDTTHLTSGSVTTARQGHGNLYLPDPGNILRPADSALQVDASAARGQTSPARNPNISRT